MKYLYPRTKESLQQTYCDVSLFKLLILFAREARCVLNERYQPDPTEGRVREEFSSGKEKIRPPPGLSTKVTWSCFDKYFCKANYQRCSRRAIHKLRIVVICIH